MKIPDDFMGISETVQMKDICILQSTVWIQEDCLISTGIDPLVIGSYSPCIYPLIEPTNYPTSIFLSRGKDLAIRQRNRCSLFPVVFNSIINFCPSASEWLGYISGAALKSQDQEIHLTRGVQ